METRAAENSPRKVTVWSANGKNDKKITTVRFTDGFIILVYCGIFALLYAISENCIYMNQPGKKQKSTQWCHLSYMSLYIPVIWHVCVQRNVKGHQAKYNLKVNGSLLMSKWTLWRYTQGYIIYV